MLRRESTTGWINHWKGMPDAMLRRLYDVYLEYKMSGVRMQELTKEMYRRKLLSHSAGEAKVQFIVNDRCVCSVLYDDLYIKPKFWIGDVVKDNCIPTTNTKQEA